MRSLTLIFLSSLVWATAARAESPLRVAATTTDLGSIAETVGGEDVEVTTFVRGGQDPHFVEARPSFIRVLSRADLFVYVGLQLEIGWVPPLLQNARNPRIQPGGAGALDASQGIPLLGILSGDVDRSMGDVHAKGNPHYLLDPVNGIRVARALRDRLAALRPERAEAFRSRTRAFEEALLAKLVGEAVLAAHGPDAVASALLEERLGDLLGDTPPGGWLGLLEPDRGKAVIADHNLWPYFARRFGLEVAGFLEPLPGITPTTRQLATIVDLMKARGIRAILSAAYFSPRYAEKVAAASGGVMVEMANQVGAREGVDDYLEMMDWNVRSLADVL